MSFASPFLVLQSIRNRDCVKKMFLIYVVNFYLKWFILVNYRPQEVAEIVPRGPASSNGGILRNLRATAKPGNR